MARATAEESSILQMALVGYQIEKDKIEGKIREIESQLKGNRTSSSSSAAAGAAPRRVLSAAARRRIAVAQKKRWAEHRKKVAMAAKQE